MAYWFKHWPVSPYLIELPRYVLCSIEETKICWYGQFETVGINIIFTLANIGYGSNSVARLQESK